MHSPRIEPAPRPVCHGNHGETTIKTYNDQIEVKETLCLSDGKPCMKSDESQVDESQRHEDKERKRGYYGIIMIIIVIIIIIIIIPFLKLLKDLPQVSIDFKVMF